MIAGLFQGKFMAYSFIMMAVLLLLVACGGAAATPVSPTATPALQQPTATTAPAATTTAPMPTPAAQPTSPPAAQPQTAKEKAVAVIAVEPEHLSLRNIDAHGGQLLDTISGYIGHVDRDTRKVAPSSLIKS
jgi:outer membrane receptor protein involved in Fe transport